jgi:hypothetical protein
LRLEFTEIQANDILTPIFYPTLSETSLGLATPPNFASKLSTVKVA